MNRLKKIFALFGLTALLIAPLLLTGFFNDDQESRNIAIFKQHKSGVVYISTLNTVIDYHHLRFDRIPRGTGSGFIWDKKGHVVTNYHVIAHCDAARVKLSNGHSYKAYLVGYDKSHDIAVLKIDVSDKEKLHVIPKGNSSALQVGQFVYAIGNPFGLDWTMTAGIISALERNLYHIPHVRIRHAIQTDAAINPGNSGGPLLDSHGRVIGVNSALYSPSGAYAGIGFAIPIDIVKRVVSQIITKGHYEAPVIGIYSDDRINRYIKEAYDIEGVAILDLMPKSDLNRYDIRKTVLYSTGEIALGDVITRIDGKSIDSLEKLTNYLDKKQKGDKVTLTLLRNRKKRHVTVTLK